MITGSTQRKPIRNPKIGQARQSEGIRESLHSSAIALVIEEIVAELLPMQATQVFKQILQKVVPLSDSLEDLGCLLGVMQNNKPFSVGYRSHHISGHRTGTTEIGISVDRLAFSRKTIEVLPVKRICF